MRSKKEKSEGGEWAKRIRPIKEVGDWGRNKSSWIGLKKHKGVNLVIL